MSEVVITVDKFRKAFPEFTVEKYPDEFIERFIVMATSFISTRNFRIRPEVRLLAIEYMMAHLISLSAVGGDGSTTGSDGNIIVSSSIGSVSVGIQAPIARNAFEQWIQSTGYGKQYWALMKMNNPTGIFWVGNPSAFGVR